VLQIKQIKDYAKASGHTIKKIYTAEQRFDFVKHLDGIKVTNALFTKCMEEEIDLIYIDIQRYRRNSLLRDFLRLHRSNKKHKDRNERFKFKIIAIPAEPETMDAIERQARLEAARRIKKITNKFDADEEDEKKKKKEEKYTEFEDWVIENKVTTKRLNNFKHLYHGVVPIYKVVLDNAEKSSRDIAKALNKDIYLTVDGKRWNRHNVQKTKSLIESDLFDEYVEFRDEKRRDIEFK
jgi:hypothetical protein